MRLNPSLVICSAFALWQRRSHGSVSNVLKRILVFLLCCLLCTPVAGAKPPADRNAISSAKKAAKKGAKLARKRKYGEATKLFAQAEALHQSWIYPFKLAEVLVKSNEYILAWEALERAANYGVPVSRQRVYDRLSQKIDDVLLRDHVLLELEVTPEDAEVEVEGERWSKPFQKWVARAKSRIVLKHPNYAPKVHDWDHGPRGQMYLELQMQPAEEFGRILVQGAPEGADVLFNGKKSGQLPRAQSPLLAPGRHKIAISKDGYLTLSTSRLVYADQVTTMEVDLDAEMSDFVRMLTTKRFWGWTTASIGAVTLISSFALYGYSVSLQSDAEDLNRTHTSGYTSYEKKYDRLADEIDTYGGAAHLSLGAGIVLGGAGAALLLWEYGYFGTEKKRKTADGSSLKFVPYPGGALARIQF